MYLIIYLRKLLALPDIKIDYFNILSYNFQFWDVGWVKILLKLKIYLIIFCLLSSNLCLRVQIKFYKICNCIFVIHFELLPHNINLPNKIWIFNIFQFLWELFQILIWWYVIWEFFLLYFLKLDKFIFFS